MEAEEGPEPRVVRRRALAGEGGVLLEPRFGHVLAVAVGDLVAEAGAEPRLLHGLRDPPERAADRARARVVVDEGRRPLPDGVHQDHLRAHLDVVEGELPVEAPQEVLEDLLEVGARRGLPEAAHERRVEVHVGVHEPGEDELPPGVEDAVEGTVDLAGRRDPCDPAVFDEDVVALEDPAGLPEGHERSVPDQEPHRFLLRTNGGPGVSRGRPPR